MSDTQLKTYQLSGKVPPVAFFYWGVSLLVAAIISVVYTNLTVKIHIVFLNPIFFGFLLFLLSKMAKTLVKTGQIRNTAFGFIFGAGVGAVAIYVSWALTQSMMVASLNGNQGVSQWEVSYSLANIIQAARETSNAVWYQVAGFEINGGLLQVVWLIESMLIILVPGLIGFIQVQKHSFCETCQDWTEQQGGIIAFHHDEPAKMLEDFEKGSFEFMDQTKAIFNTPMHDYYQINAEVCASCNDFFTITLLQMKKESDIDKTKPKILANRRLISRPLFQHFMLLSNQYPIPEV